MSNFVPPTPAQLQAAYAAGKIKTFAPGALTPLPQAVAAAIANNMSATKPKVTQVTGLPFNQVKNVIDTIISVLPQIGFDLPAGGSSAAGVSGCDDSHECKNHHGGCTGLEGCEGLSQCDTESCSDHSCTGTHSCGENDCQGHSCNDQQCAPEHHNSVIVTSFESTSSGGTPAFDVPSWSALVKQFALNQATSTQIANRLRIYVQV